MRSCCCCRPPQSVVVVPAAPGHWSSADGVKQRAELWLGAGKGWVRTKARGAAACVHLGNSGRDVSLAEPGFLPRPLPSLTPRGICFLPKGTNVHRLQTGAVHLPEPARASVVLGPCFLKTGFVASIENQKLVHKKLHLLLLWKHQVVWPHSGK